MCIFITKTQFCNKFLSQNRLMRLVLFYFLINFRSTKNQYKRTSNRHPLIYSIFNNIKKIYSLKFKFKTSTVHSWLKSAPAPIPKKKIINKIFDLFTHYEFLRQFRVMLKPTLERYIPANANTCPLVRQSIPSSIGVI